MEKDRENTSMNVDQGKETNQTENEHNTIEISKAINRRRQSKIFDLTFGDCVETYGRKEDAQIASWNYLKEMKEVAKSIVSNVGTIGRGMGSEFGTELISETYHDLVEMNEVLKLRIRIAEIVKQREDLDEEWRTVFAETNDLDILRGVLKVLETSTPEYTTPLLEDIFGLTEDCALYEIYIEQIMNYYKAKADFPYSQVINFLDANLYWVAKIDAIDYITDLLREYGKQKISVPFSAELRERLERDIPFLSGTGIFDVKDEESVIKIINGIFIRFNRIPQIGEQSFDPIIDVTHKENDGNVVPIYKVKK